MTLAPIALTSLGAVYGVASLALGFWFVGSAARLVREGTDAAARRCFLVSLAYLCGVFAAMISDLALGLALA